MHKPLLIGYIAGGVAIWISIVYHTVRMACCLRPDPPLRPRRYYNPMNVIFYPADLTPEGQRYRQRAILSILIFLAFLWLGIVLRAIA
ncbi:MAG TPA: hypothetical protein VGR70_12305 [Stellaceae bacterium]|nr:hypothetical protein [Stellaceae bacterium]